MRRRLLLGLLIGLPFFTAAIAATDAQSFSNISSSTSGFVLHGGKYLFCAVATFGGGSVELDVLGPDASTWLSVASATHLTANDCGTADIPSGTYRITIATATGVSATVAGVPYLE